jgi:hypothetical protein
MRGGNGGIKLGRAQSLVDREAKSSGPVGARWTRQGRQAVRSERHGVQGNVAELMLHSRHYRDGDNVATARAFVRFARGRSLADVLSPLFRGDLG